MGVLLVVSVGMDSGVTLPRIVSLFRINRCHTRFNFWSPSIIVSVAVVFTCTDHGCVPEHMTIAVIVTAFLPHMFPRQKTMLEGRQVGCALARSACRDKTHRCTAFSAPLICIPMPCSTCGVQCVATLSPTQRICHQTTHMRVPLLAGR
jgi:hypothetical protein